MSQDLAPGRARCGVGTLGLLLLLAFTAPLEAAAYGYGSGAYAVSAGGHVDGGVRYLNSPGTLNSAPERLGLPIAGSQWLLWGGGVTLEKTELRLQAGAWTGALHAEGTGGRTDWNLQLGELALEQLYPRGNFLLTGGACLDYGELSGTLTGSGGHSSVRAPLWGGGVTAGLRWPRTTALGFFVRSGWIWLIGQGDWWGDQAGLLGSQRFELSGPGLTAQAELRF